MKKASDVFKSIRFAKSEPRGKAHKSTDDEGHYTVGEKEFNQQLQHVKKMAMMEAVKDKFDIGEYDQEGDMAKSDLRSILANAKRVHDMLEDSDNLPEWVQSKITKAEDYMSTVANYMEAEMNEEVVNEMDTYPHPDSKEGKALTKAFKSSAKKDPTDLNAPGKSPTVKQTTSALLPMLNKSFKKSMKKEEVELQESGGPVVYKKGDDHIEKYGEDSFALYKDGKKAKYYTSLAAAKEAMNEEVKAVTVKHKTSGKELVVTPEKAKQLKPQGYHPVKEDVEQIDEKNVPTSPEKWAQAKAQAKAKFDVYPSAYANGWAAKKYKEMGGGWKSVSEAKEEKPPFDPDPPRKQQVVAGKYGAGYSTARHLARMAMQKQSEKMKKPIKEEEMSNKAKIVKTIAKKKKDSADSFQKDPIISKSEVKM